MLDEERERRLQFTSDILFALKNSGCSQRLIAAYMRISHASLSHWRHAKEDPSRKAGVPTDEQLAKLVALWRYHLGQIMGQAFGCYDDHGAERRESVLMLHAIGMLLRESSGHYENRQKDLDAYTARVHKIIELLGVEEAKRVLKPTYFTSWEGQPDPTPEEWATAETTNRAVAEQILEAIKVTDADMIRAQEDMAAWVQKQRDRLKAKTLEKIRQQEAEARERVLRQSQGDPDEHPAEA